MVNKGGDKFLPEAQSSLWRKAYPRAVYSSLRQEIEVDVVIVGGGISGLTTAYLLKKAGKRVAVLEKRMLGSGTTGGTTGKVTAQHGLIYANLQKQWNKRVARIYAEASKRALADIAKIIAEEKIDCGWRTADNYVYTADPERVKEFKDEARIAASLGLPATFEKSSKLPFSITAAVKFASQATFNAVGYIHALAQIVNGQGSYVFEQSEAEHIYEGKPGEVKTKEGIARAQHIVIATKIPTGPLAARVTYGLIEYPQTSYIVAGKYYGDLEDMYISPDPSHYSLLPVHTEQGSMLLVGGENHIPGLGNSKHRQQKLAEYGQRYFGITDWEYRWKAMDYLGYDLLPVVGELYPWSQQIYAISGLKKWGLCLSMVAATLLRDRILEVPNPTAELFTPHRFSAPLSIPKAIFSQL